ncbi:CidA/LrgA family protein [Paenalcaligenes hominis]|uniref:CidA/LrgA family protein n=1 Tax=Paenalcaligenes hominis TaxID=643674 RepID=UPI003607C892
MPGPLAGMLLLLLLLLYVSVYRCFGTTSSWLVSHLMLLFIPAVAGVMASFGQLKKEWLPFIVAG